MTKKLEFVGTVEMKRKVLVTLASRLRYGTLGRMFKKLLYYDGTTIYGDTLRDMSVLIYTEFKRESRKWGVKLQNNEDNKKMFTGLTGRGCKIFLPYYPTDPRTVEIELWRNKEVLTILAPDQDAEKVFYCSLYMLGQDVKSLKEPIEIDGTVLRLGNWIAALTCKAMEDQASFQMYFDEGWEATQDAGLAPLSPLPPKVLSRDEQFEELLKTISSNSTKQILISIRSKLPNMPVPTFEHDTFTWGEYARVYKDYLDFPVYELTHKGAWTKVKEEDFFYILEQLWR